MEVGGEGAELWAVGKTTIWHLKVRLYDFQGRSVGAGP